MRALYTTVYALKENSVIAWDQVDFCDYFVSDMKNVTFPSILPCKFLSNLKRPACASKQDMLELVTLRYANVG